MSNGIDLSKWNMDEVNAVKEEDFKERKALLESLEKYRNPEKGQKVDLGIKSYGNDLPSLVEDRSPSSKFTYSDPPVADAVKRERKKEAYSEDLERFYNKEKGQERDLGIKYYGNDLQSLEEEPTPTNKFTHPDPPIVAAIKKEREQEAFLKKQDELIKQDRADAGEISDDDAYDYREYVHPKKKHFEDYETGSERLPLDATQLMQNISRENKEGTQSLPLDADTSVVGRDLLTGREDYADPSEKSWSDYAGEAWEGAKKGAGWLGDKWKGYRKWASDPENIRWGQYLGDVLGMEKKLQGAVGDQQVRMMMGYPGSSMKAMRDAVPESPWIDIIEMRKRDEAKKKRAGFEDLLSKYFAKELGVADDSKPSLSLRDVPKLRPGSYGESDDIKRLLGTRDTGGPELPYEGDEKGFWMAAAAMAKQKKDDIGKSIAEGAARTAEAQMTAGNQMMGQMQGPLDLSGGTGFGVGKPIKIAKKKDPEKKDGPTDEIDYEAEGLEIDTTSTGEEDIPELKEDPYKDQDFQFGPPATAMGGPEFKEEDEADKIGRAVTYESDEKGAPISLEQIDVEGQFTRKEKDEKDEIDNLARAIAIVEENIRGGKPEVISTGEIELSRGKAADPYERGMSVGKPSKWSDITKTLEGEVDDKDEDVDTRTTPTQAFDKVASIMALSKNLGEMDEIGIRRPELKIEKLLEQLKEKEEERTDVEMARVYQEKQQALRDRFRPPQTIRVVRG